MKGLKSEALDGKDNKRLNNTTCSHSELTEARANIEKELAHSHVTIPSESNVINDKEWVDNGSKL
nr:DUF3787 domain-containing protein [uncultured Cellulosilyticum sp.]